MAALNKQVIQREDYILALENENIFLREEIKKTKFHCEKNQYEKFLGGLTVLRKSSNSIERNNTRNVNSMQEKSLTRGSIERYSELKFSPGPLKERIRDKF